MYQNTTGSSMRFHSSSRCVAMNRHWPASETINCCAIWMRMYSGSCSTVSHALISLFSSLCSKQIDSSIVRPSKLADSRPTEPTTG